MRETKSVTVDGEEFTIHQLPPTKAFPIISQLMRVVGPALGDLDMLKGGDKNLLDKEVDIGQIMGAISSVLESVGDDNIVPLIKKILDPAYVRKVDKHEDFVKFDVYFTDKGLFHCLKLCFEVCKVNFADFLHIKDDL